MPLDPRHTGGAVVPEITSLEGIKDAFDTELNRKAMAPEDAAVEEQINNYDAFKRIARGWKSGTLQVESGLVDYDAALADPPTPETVRQQEAIEKELTELGQDGTGFTSWMTKAARIAGQVYATATTPHREALGAVTESRSPLDFAQRLAGAAQGISQPAAGFVYSGFRSATGDSYSQSVKLGVEPNIALITAFTTGALIAGLDAAGAAGAAAPLTFAAKNLIKTQVAKVATSPKVIQMAGRVVAAYGGSIASEVPTEMLQEGIQIAAEEIGKKLTSEQLEAITEEEIYERIENVAVETLKGMAILAIPGGAAQVAVEGGRIRDAKRLREVLDESKKALDEAKDPVVAVQQFVTALDDNDVKEFFISADAVVEAANKSGDPEAFYNELGVGNQIKEAALLGGDVRMDVPRGVALMQSDQWDLLKDHIRLKEEAMSPFEEEELRESGLDEEIASAETEEGTITAQFGEPEFIEFSEGEKIRDQVQAAVKIDDQVFVAETHDAAVRLAVAALGPEIETRIDQSEDPNQFFGYAKRPEVEIQEQLDEEKFGLQGFFKNAADAGMTDAQYQTYLVALQKAADSRNAAKERIALKKEKRENEEEIKAKRAELEETARETVDVQPVYAALNALEGRERLDRDKLVGLGVDLDSLPKVKGRQIYEKGGTIDPSVFAELYGFEGADIMAFSMMDTKPRAEAIKLETDRLFNERYVGLTAKQQELDAAIEALHNDSQAAVLAMELNQLREAVGQKRVNPRLLKIAARDRLKDFPLKEINPKRYLAYERREARTAAKLLRKGDRLGASKAKFRELLNFQFAMEAFRVRDRVKNQHKYLRKFNRRAKQGAKLPIDYFLAIQAMLGEIDLKRSRPTLVDFVLSKKVNEGIIIDIPMSVQVDNGKTNYLDLTLRKWEQMVEHVKEVEKKGLDENKFLREQEKQTRDERAAGVAENVRTNLKNVANETIVPSRWESAVRNGRDLALNMTSVESIARQVDGYEELGAAHNAIVKPYFDAMINGYHPGQIGFIARHKKEARRLNELIAIFTKKEQREAKKRITIPGITSHEGRMHHERLLMALMNVGNVENRKALVDGGSFTEAEIDILINHATKKDWDFVQSVWDYFEEFWPEVVESSKRRRNVVPKKVDATSIDTPHGTYRGGYFPLMYDFDEVTMTRAALESDVAKLVESQKLGGYLQTQTKHGHALNREDNANRAVRLDLFNINSHVNQVVYDLEVGDAAMDIYKLLYHKDVTGAFTETGQKQRWEQLSVWFGDVVLGEKHFQDIVSRAFRHIRTGFVISTIGFKAMTVVLQLTGLTNTMVQLGKMNTLKGLGSAMFNPRAAWYATTATPFMEQRAATYNYDIMQAETAFKNSVSKRVPGLEPAASMAFLALIKMQKVADTITFIAAQRKGIKDFGGTNLAPVQDFSRFTETAFHGSLDVIEKFDTGRSHLGKESGMNAIYFAQKPELANRFAMREATDEDPAIFPDDPDFAEKVKGLVNNKDRVKFEAEFAEWKQLDADRELLNDTEKRHYDQLFDHMMDWGKKASVFIDPETMQATKRPNLSKARIAPGRQLVVDMQGMWDWDQETAALKKAKEGGYDSVKMTNTGQGDIIAVFKSEDVMFETDFRRNEQGRLTEREILKKANEYADNMVARSQSSGVFGLRTPIERGTTARRYQQNEVVKALIPFMSYFLAKANIAYERIAKTNPRAPVEVIYLILDLFILTVPEQLIYAWLMGDWPEDEDDLPGFAAWQITKSAAAMFPGVRDMVSFAEGFTGGGVTASVANQAGNFLKQATQGELDAALVKAAARVTGTFARIPGTAQGVATGSAIAEESENPMDYLRGPQK